MSAFEISQRWGPMAWDLARHNEIVTSSIPFPASPCSCRFCATYIASDIRELMIILVFHIIGLGLSMVVFFFLRGCVIAQLYNCPLSLHFFDHDP